MFCRYEGANEINARDVIIRLTVDLVSKVEQELCLLFNNRMPQPGSVSEWSLSCRNRNPDVVIGHIYVVGRLGIDLIFVVL